MSNLLWFFVSEETLPFVIVLVGFGLMTGVLSRGTAFGTLGVAVLIVVASSFIPMVLDVLPFSVVALLIVFVAISFLRALLSVALGERAAGHTVGILAADVIRFAVRMLFLPMRIVFVAVRALLFGRITW